MKIPTDRRLSSEHYSPYPPSHHPPPSPVTFAHPAPPTAPDSRPRASSSISIPQIQDEGSQQYKVARAISSCTRCRSRKQRCDGKLPACSACERAKVECIGFDAISKTNVSRNYLHTLEEEVASLRAQVAALTDRNNDHIGNHKRSIAANANAAIQNYRPDGHGHSHAPSLAIDPSLVHASGDGTETPLRSPWDSPAMSSRRSIDYLPSTPYGSDPPRSPFQASRPGMPGTHAASLTRLVHDAALKTGHAANTSLMNAPPAVGGSNGSASERGSVVGVSPAGSGHAAEGEIVNSPDRVPTPRSGTNGQFARQGPGTSPLNATASISIGSNSLKPKRHKFPIPPLPPQPAVERLVAAYVDFVGVAAPIVHIPTLGKQLIRIREATDVEESDVFVVMMVLALSTMASARFVDPPDELRTCSEAFHAEAMKHLDAVFEEQSYVGLQAILLLVWYSLLNPEKGSVWFLVGLATRTCVDLGFHNEHNTQIEQLDALELDMRRRLFWVTYKMDRLLSQSLGRPPSIPDGFINVALPSALHDVDIHASLYGPLSGETCAYKSVFLHTIKLRQLQSEILSYTYGCHDAAPPSPEWFDNCFERLKQWLATTPEPRGTMSAEGYAISFHNSALLLFRPSLGNPRPDRNALSTVLASSSYIIRIYRRMQLNNRISWFWMTSHFTFMAGLSFLYAYFNLYSAGGTNVPTTEEAMLDVESALAVLEYLSPRVPSAAACHDTMRAVSQAIFEQLSKTAPPAVASPGGRNLLRGAPISSSRDDPLPNETFPAPLPPVTLPYELSLLDNLFLNPMASHSKASDYTGSKNRLLRILPATPATSSYPGESSYGTAPQGFPPGAFHTFPASEGMNGLNGLGPYGIAAQVGTPNPSASITAFDGSTGVGGGGLNGASGRADSAIDPSLQGVMANGLGGDGEGGFDILNFLMDEDGLGAGPGWDGMDVPPDFSFWG